MPRLHGIREIKFVPESWAGDERGYKWEHVTDPIVIEHYAEYFERGIVRARDQITRCGELEHKAEIGHGVGGCGGKRPDGQYQCAFWLERLEACSRTPERTKLVRIHIPVD